MKLRIPGKQALDEPAAQNVEGRAVYLVVGLQEAFSIAS